MTFKQSHVLINALIGKVAPTTTGILSPARLHKTRSRITIGVMFSPTNTALFGLVAMMAWAVISLFGLSFRNALLVISIMCVLWLIVIWRELHSTPKS